MKEKNLFDILGNAEDEVLLPVREEVLQQLQAWDKSIPSAMQFISSQEDCLAPDA